MKALPNEDANDILTLPTPGEWVTSRDAVPAGHVQITVYAETGGRGTRVATVFDREANATLIAAAPKLLKACKAQHEVIDTLFAMLIERDDKFFPTKCGFWPTVLMANATIAEATQ